MLGKKKRWKWVVQCVFSSSDFCQVRRQPSLQLRKIRWTYQVSVQNWFQPKQPLILKDSVGLSLYLELIWATSKVQPRPVVCESQAHLVWLSNAAVQRRRRSESSWEAQTDDKPPPEMQRTAEDHKNGTHGAATAHGLVLWINDGFEMLQDASTS